MSELSRAGGIVVAVGASPEASEVLWARLDRLPVVAHALGAVAATPRVERIVLVVRPERADRARRLARRLSAAIVVIPVSDERAAVPSGFQALPDDHEWIVLLDAARPFVTADLIAAGLAAARTSGTALCVAPVNETLKRVNAHGDVIATPDRSRLASVITPQIYRRDALLAMIDAGVAWPPAQVPRGAATFAGDHASLRVTDAGDLAVARALLAGLRDRS